ncbi:permease [Evansella tamaricis]|uniref:Permease n=1 Tax=Evansella tamaricis TaxID=2069301 RepID=A0ABS6JB58_9BACI|nr:permease [Evansella tamaricis]MBU9710914.1 permease [Evansella tamaricis]
MNTYDNFNLAIYCTASCLDSSFEQIEQELAFFEKHLKVSKVYIESHRGDVTLSKDRLQELKKFFNGRGIEVAGGITPTLGEKYRQGYNRLFGGICYTDNDSRSKFKEVVEVTASVFDEIILDDFFFTNCGCDDCLSQKGDRSWEEFRLDLMKEVSCNLVVNPAKAVNPNVKMVIKYPNWNESYTFSGYNTKEQPQIFDGVYTGTETRDPAISQQHLPRYASFSLMTWMENMSPGKNGGGWFDSLDCTYIDYYLEQANLTVFGKAKELTLFCYSILKDSNYIPALGFQLDKLDLIAGELGNPLGVSVYQPHYGKGEDHIYDYLGMMGIPMVLTPEFSSGGNEPIFLSASAGGDDKIIDKMKTYLKNGGHIIMTSGFVEKMEGKGIEEFTSLRSTGKKLSVREFGIDTASCTFDDFSYSSEAIVYPVFDYRTNSTWQSVVAFQSQNNIPVLMYDNYSRGKVTTIIIPDNYSQLWKLPHQVVTKIRSCFNSSIISYEVDGPGNIGFFLYDNDKFILETFTSRPENWEVKLPKGKKLVVIDKWGIHSVIPITYHEKDETKVYEIKLAPSDFRLFQVIDLN